MTSEPWEAFTPSFDCLMRGHLIGEQQIGLACASWCLWCGGGVTNEHEPEAAADWRLLLGPDWVPPLSVPEAGS